MNDFTEKLAPGGEGHTFTLADPNYDHLWEELLQKDIDEIKRNALVQIAGANRFVITMAGADYLLDAQARSVTGPADRLMPDKRTVLSLAYYLNGATADSLSNNMVPEKVLPGGDRFFAGTHALKREPILKNFAQSGSDFIGAAESLGAEILSKGPDAFSFKLRLLPKIMVQVILGEEDEEFPAQVSYAFDDSAVKHVSLGVLANLISILNDQMVLSAS